MKLDDYRNKLAYEELPNWRKFIHAYLFSIKTTGLSGIYRYPIAYMKLKKLINKHGKKT